MFCPVLVICVLLQNFFRNRGSCVSPGGDPAQILVLAILIIGFQEPGLSIMVLTGVDLPKDRARKLTKDKYIKCNNTFICKENTYKNN